MQSGSGAMTNIGVDRRPPSELTAVVFRVPADFGGRHADVAGDFTAWVPLSMEREPSGGFALSLRLERGRRWRYRFLLDGEHWVNDPNAPDFVTGPNGGAASVLHT